MPLKDLKELLDRLDIGSGQIAEGTMISGPAKLSEAKQEHISFLANLKYEAELYDTNAVAVLVARNYVPRKAVTTLLIPVDDPYQAMMGILEIFAERPELKGISEQASIAESAKIGDDVYIGPFAVIGENVTVGRRTKIHAQVYLGDNVVIGKDTVLHPGVKIYHDCEVRDNCIIHAGTVIGSDGFGFAPDGEGVMHKVPQIGNVVIKEHVEVGSNCTIDRATMGSTVLAYGVKLDNLIQVGHNAVIDTNTVIAAQSGVSGSTKIGRNCMIGGQVGFAGHLVIASGTRINAKSGVSKSVKEKGARLNGIPAFNFTDSLRSQSVYRKLPEMEKRLKELEEMLSLLRK